MLLKQTLLAVFEAKNSEKSREESLSKGKKQTDGHFVQLNILRTVRHVKSVHHKPVASVPNVSILKTELLSTRYFNSLVTQVFRCHVTNS